MISKILFGADLFDAHLGAVPEDAAARRPRDHVGAVAMPDLLLAPFDVGDGVCAVLSRFSVPLGFSKPNLLNKRLY